jgi:hypothetical protein
MEIMCIFFISILFDSYHLTHYICSVLVKCSYKEIVIIKIYVKNLVYTLTIISVMWSNYLIYMKKKLINLLVDNVLLVIFYFKLYKILIMNSEIK